MYKPKFYIIAVIGLSLLKILIIWVESFWRYPLSHSRRRVIALGRFLERFHAFSYVIPFLILLYYPIWWEQHCIYPVIR